MTRSARGTKDVPRPRLSSAAALLASIGPDVVQVTAPSAGVKILVDRPDLAEFARRRNLPAPLSAAVRSIIAEGLQKQTQASNIERYLDLCYHLVASCARVDPPELAEAMAADEAEHERLVGLWQAELDAARAALSAAEGTDDETMRRIEAEAVKAAQPKPVTASVDKVLGEIDASELRPLFVERDPDEDQLVLLPPGDPGRPSAEHRVFKFSVSDYFAMGPQIMLHQEGGFGMFRA
ncbi:MAG: hypothetical protein DYG90_06195 [Chloroflexi bacterium CFX6]|nr:hypothetical protein [Chloroflexi bacterium CFX6]